MKTNFSSIKRLSNLLIAIIIAIVFYLPIYAQPFKYDTREFSAIKHADTLKTGGPNNKPFILVDELKESYYPSNLNSSNYKFKSAHLFIRAYINHEYEKIVDSPYTYKISYQFKGYNRFANSQMYSGDLIIGYSPDSVATFQDINSYKYSDIFKVEDFTIVDIYEISDTSVPPKSVKFQTDSLQENFIIEAAIVTQLYDLQYHLSSLNNAYTAHPEKNHLDIAWNVIGTSGAFAPSPAAFELEWTYIDNYGINDTSEVNINDLSYNFRHNSTRVWLDSNNYHLPLVYEKGYIVYRVRMVKPDSVYYKYPVYGPWSIVADSGALSGVASSNIYQINSPYLGDSLNWQYTVSFAEDGKYKHVLSYYDGLLKNRQSITRFNSDPNNLIVTENIYDYEGRPSIKILPTPVDTEAFIFQGEISTGYYTDSSYKAADFDTLNLDTCLVEVNPPKLKSTALADIYYSTNNPNQEGAQGYVPDAGGYPFIQTVYDPVDDKKVLVQGGAGASLQLGQGHYTRNEYVGETQATLNQLFGINAGWDNFYRKNVTTDPNGQTSVNVIDYKGRPVMSAMLGSGPDSNTHAIISNDSIPDTTYLEQELIKHQLQTVVDLQKSLDKPFYVDFDGNAEMKYKYIFNAYQIPWCGGYGLKVAANYLYYVSDLCGMEGSYSSGAIGSNGYVINETTISDSASESTFLKKGKHRLYKKLWIEEKDILAAVDSFIAFHPSCLHNVHYFIRDEFKKRTWPCQTESIDPCKEKEREMLSDMFPGIGKYGNYYLVDSGYIVNGQHSIFTYDETKGGHRYEASCLNIRNTTHTNGITYSGFTHPVTNFINAFNDSIAKDVLPLHPEYCKLLGCWVDTFREQLISIPDAKTAESIGLLTLEDIIAEDPLTNRITQPPLNFPNPEELLSTLVNGIHIDSLVLPLVYCNCGDSVLFGKCRQKIFKDEIENGVLINDVVKDKYFKAMLELYIQNRQRYVDALLSGNNDSCVCDSMRIDSLKPPPVFDNSWGADGASIDTNSFWYKLTDNPSLDSALAFAQQLVLMSDSALLLFSDSAQAIITQANLDYCNGSVENIMKRLSNCIKADTILRNKIEDSLTAMCTNEEVDDGVFSPEQIRYALETNGVSLDDLCNPYIIDYFVPPLHSPQKNRYCKESEFYADIQSFLNRDNVLASLSDGGGSTYQVVLSPSTNGFESDIKDSLNSASDTIDVYTDFESAYNLYVLSLIKSTDTFSLYFRGGVTGGSSICDSIFNGLSVSDTVRFTDIKCVNDYPGSIGLSYASLLSFVAEVERTDGVTTNTCTLIGWTDVIEMTSQSEDKLAGSVPCTQMFDLYNEFTDTLLSYSIKGIDHPSFRWMLPGFMNYKLNRNYSFYQYEDFIESCALSDTLDANQYVTYSWLKFTDSLSADSFINDLNDIDTNVSFWLYVERDSLTDSVVVFVDFNQIPFTELWQYNDYIVNNTYAQGIHVNERLYSSQDTNTLGYFVVHNIYFDSLDNYVNGVVPDNILFGDDYDDHFEVAEGETVYLKVNSTWVRAKKYYVNEVLIADHEDRSVAMYNAINYIRSKYWSIDVHSNIESHVNNDYFNSDKQDFLNYVYSAQSSTVRRVLDSLQEDSLNYHVYTTDYATYTTDVHPENTENLYMSNVINNFYDTLEMLFDSVTTRFQRDYLWSTTVFFYDQNMTADTFGHTNGGVHEHFTYRCSDENYLYIHFNGYSDKMYYAFVNVPRYLTRARQQDYIFDALNPLPADGESRYFELVLRKRTDASSKIKLFGRAGFVIANTETLEDVLLNKSLRDREMVRDTVDNCEQSMLNDVVVVGTERYNLYIDSVREQLYNDFRAYIIDSVEEEMYLKMIDQKFQITLSMYDRAGNLYKTIPPEGINRIKELHFNGIDDARAADDTMQNGLPSHKKVSVYHYNTLNQLVYQKTPDGGEVQYWYDAAARLRFSQNDKQKDIGAFTYNLYDKQNRIIETGQLMLGCEYFAPTPTDTSGVSCKTYNPDDGLYYPLPDVILNVFDKDDNTINNYVWSSDREDVIITYYDTALTSMWEGFGEQDNIRKRVSAIKYFRELTPMDTFFEYYDHAVYYSYDIAGNVKALFHHFPSFERFGFNHAYKRVHYDYDLVSGKVNMLSYNRGYADQFYQRYNYDADNRIKTVETSQDGFIWRRDAEYDYYKHGPLARLSLGDLRVQGLDYFYTIQGWLKGVNSDIMKPGYDIGKDAGDSLSIHANDAYALTLQYFLDDYNPINQDHNVLSLPERQNKNLYNGNISRQITNINSLPPLAANYVYDQLNRIKNTEYDLVSVAGDSLTAIDDYMNSFSYDDDGNLLSLQRRGNGSGSSVGGISYIMDSLTYTYSSTMDNNRLLNIKDYAADNYDHDIKQDTDTVQRYVYDNTGNLIKDMVGLQDTIEWNLYNKVTKVENRTGKVKANFYYDVQGNRFAKVINQEYDTMYTDEGDYYVRDAQGNVLATYRSQVNYKYDKLVAMSALNNSVISNASFNDLKNVIIDEGYTNNSDMASAIAALVADNIDWAENDISSHNVSFFPLNNSAVYNNMVNNGTDYIVPLFQHNSGSVIGSAWKEMYNASDVTRIDEWTDALYSETTMTTTLFEYMCDADPSGDYLIADLLTEYGLIATGVCTTDAANIATAVNGGGVNAMEDLSGYLQDLYSNHTSYFESYIDELVQSSTIYNYSGYTDDPNGTLLPVVQETVYNYGDDTEYGNFLDNWIDAYDYLMATNDLENLVLVRYEDDPGALISDYYTDNGTGIVDSGVAAIEELGVETYAGAIVEHLPALEPAINTVMGQQRVDLTDICYLSEHHIYGSSRLGLKGYWPNQHYWSAEYVPSLTVNSETLNGQRPWYSLPIQDVVSKDSLNAYAPYYAGQMGMADYRGQKGYELNNHLGNVHAVVTDNKIHYDTSANDTVDTYGPSLKAVFDYYPFGMLMPGRYVQDTSQQCMSLTYVWGGIPEINHAYNKDHYPDGLIVAPDAGYNAQPVGSATVVVGTIDEVEYYNVSATEISTGIEQTVQLNAGHAHTLVMNVQATTGDFNAYLSQYVNGSWQQISSAALNTAGQTSINFTPVGSSVRLQVLRTTDGGMERITMVPEYEGEFIGAEKTKTVTICNRPCDNYRFGFNGQEKDNEIKGIGNSINYLARIYDSRLGRFMSVDPLTSKFPYYTPYQFAGNTPIQAIDLDGAEPAPPEAGKRNLLVVVQGWTHINPDEGMTQTINAQKKSINMASDDALGMVHYSLGRQHDDLQTVIFASTEGTSTKRDVINTIDMFKSTNPNAKIITVGHSLGAENLIDALESSPSTKVDLMITVDPRGTGAFRGSTNNDVGANVQNAINYWQYDFGGISGAKLDFDEGVNGKNVNIQGTSHTEIDNKLTNRIIRDVNRFLLKPSRDVDNSPKSEFQGHKRALYNERGQHGF